MDLLGSRALTTLVDALQASGLANGKGSNYGNGGKGSKGGKGDVMANLKAIPLDDERTYRMMAEGETLGCFQLPVGVARYARPLEVA